MCGGGWMESRNRQGKHRVKEGGCKPTSDDMERVAMDQVIATEQ